MQVLFIQNAKVFEVLNKFSSVFIMHQKILLRHQAQEYSMTLSSAIGFYYVIMRQNILGRHHVPEESITSLRLNIDINSDY